MQLVALVVVVAAVITGAHADVLASSVLQSCVLDGSMAAGSALNCRQQIVVTLTVPSGQSMATESTSFQLKCVNSADGVCPCTCNYAVDSTCTCRDLYQAATVTLTKSPLWATYPLQYMQSFNYKPYEVIVRPSNKVCKDADYEVSPTCRWYYLAGQQVVDSQGFCCECSTSQIFDSTLGNGPKQRTRANLNCDFFDNPLYMLIGRPACSAHCLQFDPLWFNGYRIGSSILEFNITASITFGVPPASSSPGTVALNSPTASPSSGAEPAAAGEKLVISPSVPVAISNGRTISATLQGDLAMYAALPVLSDQVLAVPPASANFNQSRWMLLRANQLSLDGGDCNKVGSSFSAFRLQPDKCARAAQTCLSGQLKDLYTGDLARIAAGRVPLYVVTQYTYGSGAQLSGASNAAASLSLPVSSGSTSLVVLRASADSVGFAVNAAPGRISNATLCTFYGVLCGGFEAGSSRGYLSATITNTGYVAATFTLSVTNCSVNIKAVVAKMLSLAPQVATVVPSFDIYVLDSTASESRYCWLKLYNSQGAVTDSCQVFFYTNATVFDEIPTGGYLGNGTGAGALKNRTDCDTVCLGMPQEVRVANVISEGSVEASKKLMYLCRVCTSKVNIACLLKNRCWSRVGMFTGVVGGILAAVLLLALAAKMGLLSSAFSLCRCCCSCLCSGGGSRSRRSSGSEYSGSRDSHKGRKRRGSGSGERGDNTTISNHYTNYMYGAPPFPKGEASGKSHEQGGWHGGGPAQQNAMPWHHAMQYPLKGAQECVREGDEVADKDMQASPLRPPPRAALPLQTAARAQPTTWQQCNSMLLEATMLHVDGKTGGNSDGGNVGNRGTCSKRGGGILDGDGRGGVVQNGRGGIAEQAVLSAVAYIATAAQQKYAKAPR